MTDQAWMELAIGLSRQSPPSGSAYCVGAVIVDDSGQEIARGYSRESDDRVHAEEAALAKAAGDPRLRQATVYSTLEPCSRRASRLLTCTQLIIAAGIPRVVFAWREPALFVASACGRELLEAAGIAVTELPEFAARARAANAHLPLPG